MANFAAIKLKFTSSLFLDQIVEFKLNANTLFEVATDYRIGINTFSAFIGGLPLTIEALARECKNAISIDYAPGGLVASYPITAYIDPIDSDTVVIEATSYGFIFATGVTIPEITYTIVQEVLPNPELEIGSISVFEADGVDKCNNAKFSFTVLNATFPITIISPIYKVATNASELFFDYGRVPVPSVTLDITDNASGAYSEPLLTVSKFQIEPVTVIELFSGATVTINTSVVNKGDEIASELYSLDGINYTVSNVFYGILPGLYTAWVKDSFGCVQSIQFEVLGIPVDKPEGIFEIPNGNGLKHYKVVDSFDNKTTFKNFDNSPINEQDYFNTDKLCYSQLVQRNDISIQQIQSNFDNIDIEIYDSKTNELVNSFPATEVKTNISQKDKRDCKIIAGITSDKTYLYFTGGNIYIPDTDTVDTIYNNPNLLLPEFLDSGTLSSGVFVTLSGNGVLNGDFEVEKAIDIIFSDGTRGRGLQINAIYTGISEGENAIVQSLYNALDFNIWQYNIDWSALTIGDYYVLTKGSDPDPRASYSDVIWKTEPINSKDFQYKTVYIEYANLNNSFGLDYSHGLVNFIRVPARFTLETDGGEREIFETSEGTIIVLKDVITSDITLDTSLIPQYIKKKISIASGHKDHLTINGLPCKQREKGESEDKFKEMNKSYTYSGIFRLDETLISTNETGIISDAGDVLGTGSGNFVLATTLN